MSAAPWTEGVSLAPLTSWRIGGPCRAFAEPDTPEELRAVRAAAARAGLPVFLLGGGSNLLFADSGYRGLVIRYRARRWTIEEPDGAHPLLVAEARAPLAGTARETARRGFAGLEWAEGIPGTMGGAIVGNAGAYGGEIAASLLWVDLQHPDGTDDRWPAERMDYGYRTSALKGLDPSGPAVTRAAFRLSRDDPSRMEAEMRGIGEERKRKTPAGASCGSVFRNPPGQSAGRLIDEAGCKGLREGAAVVSRLHANYIINEGGASAGDVLRLIDEIRRRVRNAFGISLELEIQLVGFVVP